MRSGPLEGDLALVEKLHNGRAAYIQEIRCLLSGQPRRLRHNRDGQPALHRINYLAECKVDLLRKFYLIARTCSRKEVPWLGESPTCSLMGGEEVQNRGKLFTLAGKVRLFNDRGARHGDHLNTRKRKRLRLLRLRYHASPTHR